MHFRETILNRKYKATLLLIIFFYTIIFSYVTWIKHYSFPSFGWDLGIFNQLFYSSIFGGEMVPIYSRAFPEHEGKLLSHPFQPNPDIIVPHVRGVSQSTDPSVHEVFSSEPRGPPTVPLVKGDQAHAGATHTWPHTRRAHRMTAWGKG